MPTYVYKFIDTGETIEVQQSFADDALTEAVHPGSGATMPVKKVFLPTGGVDLINESIARSSGTL